MQDQELDQYDNETKIARADIAVGTELAQARKQAGKSVDEIAEDLNLSVITIRAIENDHLDALPELTYIRGYIRSYAKLLGMDAAELLARYSGNSDAVNYDDIPSGDSDADVLISEPGSFWSKAAVILALLLVVLYLWWPDWLESSFTQSEPSAPVPSVASQAGVNQDQLEATPEAASSAAVELAGQVAPDESSTVAESVLMLNFENTSWVDARDSEGTRLAYQSVASGNSLELRSTLAMTVFLGNADGVTASLNDQPYPLDSHRQGVYAKFTVPAVAE